MTFSDKDKKTDADKPRFHHDFVKKNPAPWNRGFKILDRYEILDIKKGGMGVVYIVYDNVWKRKLAIKTFQDRFLRDEIAILRFIAEADAWTNLERHSNIVFSNFVMRVEGQPLLFLEYVDSGDLTLFIGKLGIPESLDFAIQFCTGMEYAYQKLGVIHRDIKPGNIMVQKDPAFRSGYCFKITDFGLAKVLGSEFQETVTQISTGMGTVVFMPPEQFPAEVQRRFSFSGTITARSDIYSFGVTFYLLLTGKLPFDDINQIFTRSPEHPINVNPAIPKRLDSLIIRCIEKDPAVRYPDFSTIQAELIEIFSEYTCETYTVIGKREELTGVDVLLKAIALAELGRLPEAMSFFEKAIELNPYFAGTWYSKGLALANAKNPREAIVAFDRAFELDPENAAALDNKGVAFAELGRLPEAVECYDKALRIHPKDTSVWNNRGRAILRLGNPREAMVCFDSAIAVDSKNCTAWTNKGNVCKLAGKHQEAVEFYTTALSINPGYEEAWVNKGMCLESLGNHRDAVRCFDAALELNPKNIGMLYNKGYSLTLLGNVREAIPCFEKFIEIAPPEYAQYINTSRKVVSDLKKAVE